MRLISMTSLGLMACVAVIGCGDDGGTGSGGGTTSTTSGGGQGGTSTTTSSAQGGAGTGGATTGTGGTGTGGGADVCTGCGVNQLCDPALGCVQCLTSNDCPTTGTPVCFFGRCEECGTNADCGAAQFCNAQDHQCEAKCATAQDCRLTRIRAATTADASARANPSLAALQNTRTPAIRVS